MREPRRIAGKKFLSWVILLLAAVTVALTVLRPRPLETSDYVAIALWTAVSAYVAYGLIKERSKNA